MSNTKKTLIMCLVAVAVIVGWIMLIYDASHPNTKKVDTFGETPTKTINDIKIRKLSDEIPHGLYQIAINDSTDILLYRGVESATMIQIK